MILVEIEEFGGEEICELVEIYDFNPEDPAATPAFCKARIMSPEELAVAYYDVERDGVNRWFYENGKFTFKWSMLTGEREFDWTHKNDIINNDSEEEAGADPHLT